MNTVKLMQAAAKDPKNLVLFAELSDQIAQGNRTAAQEVQNIYDGASAATAFCLAQSSEVTLDSAPTA